MTAPLVIPDPCPHRGSFFASNKEISETPLCDVCDPLCGFNGLAILHIAAFASQSAGVLQPSQRGSC